MVSTVPLIRPGLNWRGSSLWVPVTLLQTLAENLFLTGLSHQFSCAELKRNNLTISRHYMGMDNSQVMFQALLTSITYSCIPGSCVMFQLCMWTIQALPPLLKFMAPSTGQCSVLFPRCAPMLSLSQLLWWSFTQCLR